MSQWYRYTCVNKRNGQQVVFDSEIGKGENVLLGIRSLPRESDSINKDYKVVSIVAVSQCPGCREDIYNQLAHMVSGGCVENRGSQ
jgi:hypothetical protein